MASERRINVTVSDDLWRRVEDWRFASRVTTRAEAFRQLAEAGLRIHGEIATRVAELEAGIVERMAKGAADGE